MALKHAVNTVNIILFCGAAFCLFALCRLILVSDQYPPGGLSLWFVIAAALLLVCSLSLAMPTRIKTAVVLIGAGILVGCYLAEIVVCCELFGSRGCVEREARICRDPERGGIRKAPSGQCPSSIRIYVHPSFHPCQCLGFDGFTAQGAKLFPLAGVSRRLTVFCAMKQIITYQSDTHGFNNPDHVGSGRGGRRAGRRFIHTGFMRPEGKMCGHLQRGCGQRNKPGPEWILGPLLELAILIEYAQNLKPQNLVWLYFEGNDMFDLLQERKSTFLMRYLASDFCQDLVNRQENIDQVLISY